MYPAEKIRIEMAIKNLNDGDVSEKSGVHRSTVSQIKKGEADNPQLKTLEQVANAVGLEMRIDFIPLEPISMPLPNH